mgnify:CR=1 FL=1
MFLKLWEERDHISFISGKYLGSEPRAHFFAHVLPKGAFKKMKCDEENIVFLTMEEHHRQHFGSIKDDPQWQKWFELKEKLLIKYNAIT